MFDHDRDDDDGGDVDELDGVAELDRHIQTLPSNGIYHPMLPQSRTLCQGPFFAAALNITIVPHRNIAKVDILIG
jgi:hypothetical protein